MLPLTQTMWAWARLSALWAQFPNVGLGVEITTWRQFPFFPYNMIKQLILFYLIQLKLLLYLWFNSWDGLTPAHTSSVLEEGLLIMWGWIKCYSLNQLPLCVSLTQSTETHWIVPYIGRVFYRQRVLSFLNWVRGSIRVLLLEIPCIVLEGECDGQFHVQLDWTMGCPDVWLNIISGCVCDGVSWWH